MARTKHCVDADGNVSIVKLTDQEVARATARDAKHAAKIAEAAAFEQRAEAVRAGLIARLGLTADEARLLFNSKG